MNDFISPNQILLSIAVTQIIEWLKRSAWFPRLTQNTDKLNVLLSALGAAAITAGFKFGLEGNALTGWSATIHIPPVETIMAFMADTGKSMVVQEGWYRALVKPRADTAKLLDALRAAQPVIVTETKLPEEVKPA